MSYGTAELPQQVAWIVENSTNFRLQARRSHDRCEEELQALRDRMAEVRNRTLGNLPSALSEYPLGTKRNKDMLAS
jgi:hypothetical protein